MASSQPLLRCNRPAHSVAAVRSAPLRTSISFVCSPGRVVPASRSPVLPTRRSSSVQSAAALPPVPAEVFQLAGEGGFIGGTAAIIFAMTLVGLAIGFVLLRVESLVEEGKIPVD